MVVHAKEASPTESGSHFVFLSRTVMSSAHVSSSLPSELWLKILGYLAHEFERLYAHAYEPFIPWDGDLDKQRCASRHMLISVALVSRQFNTIVMPVLQCHVDFTSQLDVRQSQSGLVSFTRTSACIQSI